MSGLFAAARTRAALALVASTLLPGCASGPAPLPPAAPPACVAALDGMDARVAAAGVSDGGPRPVSGFPYLRLDRPLAALVPDDPGSAAFETWAWRARALDRVARDLEMRNLGIAPAGRERVQRCARTLLRDALDDPRSRQALARHARVEDDYSLGRRVLGLYPLAALGLLAGVAGLKADLEAAFEQPLDRLPVHGTRVRFAPREGAGDTAPVGDLPRDALGVPVPSAAVLERLFRRHAPVFEVDVVRPDDRIGRMGLDAGGEPRVDPSVPRVYRRTGLTRLGGRVLLQLEYWVWFASRPRRGPLDLLGGPLDGLVWRVTLDEDGVAVAYDSIHACGCYHLVFPTPRLAARPAPAGLEEPLLVAQQVLAPVPGHGRRLVVRVAAGSHYIRRVYPDRDTGGVTYRQGGYDELRSLPLPSGGRRSMFRSDGLVPSSARGERFVLWMSGIASPGAMRQAGRHATAFVGRRHFDDADLLDLYFQRRTP